MKRIIGLVQGWLKVDMNYLFSGSFWLLLGQLIFMLSGIIMAVVLGRFLEPSVYGEFRYILSAVAILAIPSLYGMDTSIVRAVAKGYESTFFEAQKTRIKWGLGGSLLSFGLFLYYWFF